MLKAVGEAGALSVLRASDGDELLLRRVAGGEQSALRELYDRCASQAFAVVLRILRDEREAEEVLQETFVDAWKRAAQFDRARGSALAWIVAIARSRALDRLRSRGAAERMRARAQREPEAPPRPDAPELLERREARERVGRALAELTGPQRETIELAYFEGLSQSEIAERLREPLGTVKSRTRAALQKLYQLLGERGAT
jgi:RNA polymerase sigma-70 factor (ECF subfamily)